jgi:hypothetical protein
LGGGRTGTDVAFDGIDEVFSPLSAAEQREEDDAVRRLMTVFDHDRRPGQGIVVESRTEARSLAAPRPTVSPPPDAASATVQKLEEVLRQCDEIGKATDGLSELRQEATALCAAIDRFGFDFSAIQLERRDQNTIETVVGTGIARDWVGLAKHRIEEEVRLRDIQADIFQEKRVEIVPGTDDPVLHRLDPFIGKNFHHDDVVRIFIPLVLIRDADGRVLPDGNVWESVSDHRSGCEVLKLQLPAGQYAKVIGTVEAGFKAVSDQVKRAQLQKARELASAVTVFVTQRAESIYKKTLTFVLERVAEMALRLARADIATVQWGTLGEGKKVGRWQTVGSGRGAQEFIASGEHVVGAIGGAPREGGLGADALREGQPQHLGKNLNDRNRALHDQGIRAMSVYPSARVSDLRAGQKVCLIYTHFRRERRFTDEESMWLHHLARRSGDLLPMAFELAERRDHERQLETMRRIASSFTERRRHKTMQDLLSFIAWSTLNLHGADVVTIYRCDPDRSGRLIAPPTQAGRLREPDEVDTDAKEDSPAMRVLRAHDDRFFVANVVGHRILDPRAALHGFVSRERIQSTAALRLVVGHEAGAQPVAVMFVNYREKRVFTEDEKDRLTMLGSLSAMAIKRFEKSQKTLVAESAIAALVARSLSPRPDQNSISRFHSTSRGRMHTIGSARASARRPINPS